MFYQIRFQTGEIKDIIAEMTKGNIPCMDVANNEELEWFIKKLSEEGVYRIPEIPYDRNARDRTKDPEFEFRVAFSTTFIPQDNYKTKDLMYIDFYFEPEIEETYASVGEM